MRQTVRTTFRTMRYSQDARKSLDRSSGISRSNKGPLECRLHGILGGGRVAQQGPGVATELGVMPLHQLPGRAGVAIRQALCQRFFTPHVVHDLKFGFHTHTTPRQRGKFHAGEENVPINACFAPR